MDRRSLAVSFVVTTAGCGSEGRDGLPPAPIIDECAIGQIPIVGGGCHLVGMPDGCWEGWRKTDEGACEPVLPTEDCPAFEIAEIGESECQPIQNCGPAPWGNVLADVGAIFVDASYPGADSDGSADRPFIDIQTAVAAAPAGGQVVIGAGDYDGPVPLFESVRLDGRCPELVTVHAASFAIGLAGTGTEVRGLTVTGAGNGMSLIGQDVRIENVVVMDTAGTGLFVEDGATGVAHRVRISRATQAGVAVLGSTFTLENVTIEDTAALPNGAFGVGVFDGFAFPGSPGSDVRIKRSIIRRTRQAGIAVLGSTVDLEEVVVTDVQPEPLSGSPGIGADIVYGADTPSVATIRRSLFDGNHRAGVQVWGSSAVLDEVQIRNTRSATVNFQLSGGFGIVAFADGPTQSPPAVELRHGLIADNRHMGVWVEGGLIQIEDSWIRGTASAESTRAWGAGVVAHDSQFTLAPADLTMVRSLVSDNRQTGILVGGSTATLEDVVVQDTLPIEHSGEGGRGITIQGSEITGTPAQVVVRRGIVRRNAEAGIFACGATGSLEDTIVTDTAANVADRFGDGIVLATCSNLATSMDIDNAWVEAAARAGVAFFGATGSLEATSVVGGDVAVTIEDGADPTIGSDNAFADNTTDAVVRNAGLDAPGPLTPAR